MCSHLVLNLHFISATSSKINQQFKARIWQAAYKEQFTEK